LESYEKSKKKEKEVAKVRVKSNSNGIPDLKHNHYARSNTPTAWQTDVFIRIASCHEEYLTGSIIAPADILPPEYWW